MVLFGLSSLAVGELVQGDSCMRIFLDFSFDHASREANLVGSLVGSRRSCQWVKPGFGFWKTSSFFLCGMA